MYKCTIQPADVKRGGNRSAGLWRADLFGWHRVDGRVASSTVMELTEQPAVMPRIVVLYALGLPL